MFFETPILKAFWEGFGKVLGGQKPRFSQFFREKMEAKNEMIFGRLGPFLFFSHMIHHSFSL